MYYDPLCFYNEYLYRHNNKLENKKHIFGNKHAPIFSNDFNFFINSILNEWSDFKINEKKIYYFRLFFRPIQLRLVNYNENFLDSNIFYPNYDFANETFMNVWLDKKKPFIFFLPEQLTLFNFIENFSANNIGERFPRRNVRLNILKSIFNSSQMLIYFPTEDFHGKLSLSENIFFQNRLLNSYLFNILDSENQHISFYNNELKQMISYLNYFNISFSKYINEFYQTKKLAYHLNIVQLFHIFSLDFSKIQYILFLQNEDPYYKNRLFIDIHWELFSGNHFIGKEDFNENYFYSTRRLNTNINFWNRWLFIHKILDFSKIQLIKYNVSWNVLGFFNPFDIYNISYMNQKDFPKKYFLNEQDLMVLPLHILLKSRNVSLFSDNFINYDINKRATQTALLNIIYHTGEIFPEKLVKYFEYGNFSEKGTAYKVLNNINLETPYQHFYYLAHNPWWESLNFNSQIKYINLFKLSEQFLHLISISNIDRFLERRSFFSFEEIYNLIKIDSNEKMTISKNFFLEDRKHIIHQVGFLEYISFIFEKQVFDFFFLIKNFLKNGNENKILDYYGNFINLTNKKPAYIFSEFYMDEKKNSICYKEYILSTDFYVTSKNNFNFFSFNLNYYKELFDFIKFEKRYPYYYNYLKTKNFYQEFFINENSLIKENVNKKNRSLFFNESSLIGLSFYYVLNKFIT